MAKKKNTSSKKSGGKTPEGLKEIYTRDDERLESFEQACEIHQCLEQTYRECGYDVHALEFGTVENRIRTLLETLKKANG